MSVKTFAQQVAPLTAQDRVTAQLAICFGVVALALAAVGLYGVLSYGVARRRGEIAIRIALGALPRAVVTMILKDTGRVLGVVDPSTLRSMIDELVAEPVHAEPVSTPAP